MDDQRFIDLETKSLYQEKMLEELHQALYDQQRMIEHLQLQVGQLKKRIEEASAGNGIGPANQKPPHY